MQKLLSTLTVLLALGLVRSLNLPTSKENPYQVVWQMPHNLCARFDSIDVSEFRLDDFGIINNPRGRFDGEYVSIFYHYGRFPMYAFSNPHAMDNGGIPQNSDLPFHMMDAYKDIIAEIPNPEFDGIAVLNQEEWRPLFRRNFGVKAIYQDKSVDFYKENHPEVTDLDELIQGAAAEFEFWSKTYTIESLRLGKLLRPYGKWGYYAYPYCYNYKTPVPDQCADAVREGNTEMAWLWEESSVILPSIYIFQEYEDLDRARFLYSQIEEGVRVAGLSDTYTPVYMYSKMKYNMTVPVFLYRESDMYASLRMPADFGVEGVLLWGSDKEFIDYDSCLDMKDYITTVIGPYVKQVSDWAKECSERVCNSNGRCAHRGALDRDYREEIYRLTMSELEDFTIFEKDGSTKYKCICFDERKEDPACA